MPIQHDPTRDPSRDRAFLEQMLEQCRRADLSGGERLLALLEEMLASLPPAPIDPTAAPPPRLPGEPDFYD